MTKVAIIVLNWKQPKLTVDTVDSLLKINNPNFEYKIFIVDNGSPDNSVSTFKNNYKDNKLVEVLETGWNLGYVGGNNFGINKSLKDSYDWSLIINNDVYVDKNFITELINASDSKALVLGPKIYFASGHEFHFDRYKEEDRGKVIWSAGGKIDWNNMYGSNVGVDEVDNGQFDQIIDSYDFLTGCCLMIHNSVFKKIGLFDEKFFMYLEDTDFSLRAKKAGFICRYVPKSIIWHINAGSSSSGGALHDYFITRNRLLFGFRYASLRTKFALFRESIKMLFISNSKWKKIAVFDFYRNKFQKGSWK